MNLDDVKIDQIVQISSNSSYGSKYCGVLATVRRIDGVYIALELHSHFNPSCHDCDGALTEKKGHWFYAREFEPIQKSEDRTNPKDLLGVKKVSISKFPAAGLIHGAHAMMDGARKYGPYNWRGNAVIASIYVDAAERHMIAWFDEHQENASDSGVHHLGHAIACCAILLDAQETGNLVDDRPVPGKANAILDRLAEKIKAKAEEKK